MKRLLRSRMIRRAGAWLALVALALNVVVPFGALAHAVNVPGKVALCTAAGIQLVDLGAGSGEPGDVAPATGTQCPLCSGGLAMPPPSAATLVPLQHDTGRDLRPSIERSAKRSQAVQTAARPRGPPSLI